MRYRSHYGEHSPEGQALASLLYDVFGLDLAPLAPFGGWDATATPFSYFAVDGLCIANVSLFALPLVLRGASVAAWGVQSVAVRPEHRGAGLCRDLLRRALATIGATTPALLRTAIPALYERFGFQIVAEHIFTGPPPAPHRTGPARPLTLSSPADIALLRRLFAGRTPVSQRLGVTGMIGAFALNLASKDFVRLHHLPQPDVVVASAMAGACFRLLDVVGPIIPPLAAILGALDLAPERVEVCFAPDQLDWSGSAQPLAASTVLMARGAFDAPAEPFMLSPLAAF